MMKYDLTGTRAMTIRNVGTPKLMAVDVANGGVTGEQMRQLSDVEMGTLERILRGALADAKVETRETQLKHEMIVRRAEERYNRCVEEMKARSL